MIQSTKADNCYDITKGSNHANKQHKKSMQDFKRLQILANDTCNLEKYNITEYPFEVNSRTYNTLD